MRWALGTSLRFSRLVVALAIGLMVFGIAQLRSAPVDVYPEFTPPSVEIQAEALGLSAAEVEQLITVPLEQDLVAEGRVINLSRSLGVSEASLRDADGALLAHATATCAILRQQSG